jgi:hypothetical protein
MPLNQNLKIKLHGHPHRGTQPPFEFLPEDRTYFPMILYHSTRAIHNLGNDIPPISLSGHGVKEFCILIPKLHNSLSESLLPVLILHSQKKSDVLLDNISKF